MDIIFDRSRSPEGFYDNHRVSFFSKENIFLYLFRQFYAFTRQLIRNFFFLPERLHR